MSFVLRENQQDIMRFDSTNTLHWHEKSDYIYCGKEHGIIISALDGMYQLKLQNINAFEDYKFSQMCGKWKEWDNYTHNEYLTMCYLKGMDKILAIQIDRRDFLKCGIFDLITKKWRRIATLQNPQYLLES